MKARGICPLNGLTPIETGRIGMFVSFGWRHTPMEVGGCDLFPVVLSYVVMGAWTSGSMHS